MNRSILNVKKWLLLLSLILCISLDASLPNITPRTAKKKIESILKAHVSYNRLSPDIMKRVFIAYLEELDPMKCYLLQPEIKDWLEPTDELLLNTLKAYRNGNFEEFTKIHHLLESAISRRNDMEVFLDSEELIKDVDADTLKDAPWPENDDALYDRLLQIRSLQKQTAEKLDDETKELYFKMSKKRRLIHEGEILTDEPEKWVLTHVLKATCASLDSHTNYFTPNEANQFMIQVQQRLFGIGAQLKDTLNGFTVMRVLEKGPAAKSKELKIKDRIIAVDNEPVIGLDIFEVVELIRGEKGSPVLLTVLRESEKETEKLEIEITRGEVVLEETRLETALEPFADGVIAHLKLYSFYQDPKTSCSKDIKDAIEKIRKEDNLKGVILDLRNNAGGLLDEAVKVAGLFITKGIVVSIKDNSGKLHHSRVQSSQMTWDGPLLVLTNRASASAAEIVAGSLQDYGRAIVVGDDHTYGKGTFQTLTLNANSNGKVNPSGEFKVTRGKYYTVSGKSPQLSGVKTDIEIPGMLSEIDIGESFAKFPLENDSIQPNFDDNLSDLPLIQRHQLAIYKHGLQKVLNQYRAHIPTLTKNSKKRIEQNKNYQNFLTEIQKKSFDNESVELFGLSDLQLVEAYNVMKDLIFLMTSLES